MHLVVVGLAVRRVPKCIVTTLSRSLEYGFMSSVLPLKNFRLKTDTLFDANRKCSVQGKKLNNF
jgi:hypothetical protein